MAFPNIFSRKGKGQLYIVLDVGSYSIRSLLFEYGPKGAIGLKKTASILSPKEGGESAAVKIGSHIREIILRYIKNTGKIPAKAVLGFASQYAFNALEVAKKTREDKKETITQKEIADLLGTFIENKKEVMRNNNTFVLSHAEPIHLVIDGYGVDRIKSKSLYGSSLELHLALNYVRSDFWQQLNELRLVLGGIPTEVRPSYIAVLSSLMAQNVDGDFLLIKIGGKIIEISGVRDGNIAWTETLPSGSDDITKDIAEALNIPAGRAEEIKRQYETMLLPENILATAENSVNHHVEKWLKTIHDLLIEKQFLLPSKLFLYGGGSRLAAFQRALQNKKWTADITYHDAFEVKLMDAQDFAKNIFTNQPLRGPEDIDLAALAATLIYSLK